MDKITQKATAEMSPQCATCPGQPASKCLISSGTHCALRDQLAMNKIGCFGTVLRAKLAQNTLHMLLHGLLRNV